MLLSRTGSQLLPAFNSLAGVRAMIAGALASSWASATKVASLISGLVRNNARTRGQLEGSRAKAAINGAELATPWGERFARLATSLSPRSALPAWKKCAARK